MLAQAANGEDPKMARRAAVRHRALTFAAAIGSYLAACSASNDGMRKTRFRGLARVEWAYLFAVAAYNLIRRPKLLAQTPSAALKS